jgi:hypothetical protein
MFNFLKSLGNQDDFGKYLYPGTPLVQSLQKDIMLKIVEAIMVGHQYPQMAIAGELLDSFTPETPKIWTDVTRKFKWSPQQFGEYTSGYINAFICINVAIMAYEAGESETKSYLRKIKADGYYSSRITDLKKQFANRKTCATIFDYIRNDPPMSSKYFALGVEGARIAFSMFSLAVKDEMEKHLGERKTLEIFGFS